MSNTIDTIEIVDWEQEKEQLFQRTRPALVKGLVSAWPAVSIGEKSPIDIVDYLSGFDVGKPVFVFHGAPELGGRFFYNESFTGYNFKKVQATFSQLAKRLKHAVEHPQGETFYMGSTEVTTWFTGFREQNPLCMGERDPLVSLWVGTKSTASAHFDFPSNLACCVAGKRRFTLFPPDQLENLYVGPLHLTPAGQPISVVNFNNPDFDKYPKFKIALEHAIVVDMAPGDALFLPSMWWHHVEAFDSVNVLVNFWWRESPAFMGPPLNALNHALLSLRALPKEQRAAWKTLFDYYIFDHDEADLSHIPASGIGPLGDLSDSMARQLRADILNKLNQ